MCRDASIVASTNAPIGSEIYQAADKLRVALDDMTGTLTGDRAHFSLKAHSSSSGTRSV